MQHFIISAEDVHKPLTHLNTKTSEGADEIHPKILIGLAFFLVTPLAKLYKFLLIIIHFFEVTVQCPVAEVELFYM